MSITFFYKLKYVIIVGLVILVTFICANNFICASEEENIIQDEKEKQSEEIKKYIDEYIKDIEDRIEYIDSVINDMKSQKEYIKYPAVRLNVQTPFLGIAAITESKLNIRDGVSVLDRKYSLRDVVNKKVMKVPSFSIGSITILTKELDLDSDKLTIEDGNLALYYLKIYLSNVEQVVSFVEQQKNNIFLDYVPKEIKDRIQSNNQKIEGIKKELLDTNDRLIFIFLVAYKTDEYMTLEEQYLSIYNKIIEKEEQLTNILITSRELDEIENYIKKMEEDFKKYNDRINYIYDMECLNLDINVIVENVYKEVENLDTIVGKYIKNSKQDMMINSTENQEDIEEEKIKDKEEKLSYEVNDLYIVKNEEVLTEIKNLKNELLKYKESIKSTESNEEIIDRVYTNEKYISLADEYKQKYVGILNSVCKFYENNYKYILQDTTIKTDELIKNTDVSVEKYMRDLYFNIPKEIDQFKKYDLKSTVHLKKYINSLTKNVEKISTYNIEINKMYEKKVQEGEIKS